MDAAGDDGTVGGGKRVSARADGAAQAWQGEDARWMRRALELVRERTRARPRNGATVADAAHPAGPGRGKSPGGSVL